MSDLVVDANVLAHACNPSSTYFESALALVEALLVDDRVLALDDTGKNAPVTDTSHMYLEYTECIPPGSISSALLQLLGQSERLIFLARPSREVWTKCKSLAPRNHGDQIVLGVGVRSTSSLVASNDYDDFNPKVRRSAKKILGVNICDSTEM